MAEIVIRRAVLSDCDAMYVINRDALGYDFPLEKTRKRLKLVLADDKNTIFVAEQNSEVKGYIQLESYDCIYAESMKNIMGLAVLPKEQGRGIGRLLITAAESFAKSDGAVGIRLSSGAGRTEAHKFYLACGYTMRKEQKNFVKLF